MTGLSELVRAAEEDTSVPCRARVSCAAVPGGNYPLSLGGYPFKKEHGPLTQAYRQAFRDLGACLSFFFFSFYSLSFFGCVPACLFTSASETWVRACLPVGRLACVMAPCASACLRQPACRCRSHCEP